MILNIILHYLFIIVREQAKRENIIGGQIICFLNGCPNYGLGGVLESFSNEQEVDYRVDQATKFYRQQAAIASDNNIQIDIHCVGLRNFRVRILHNIVLANGGNILLTKEFADPQLLQNLIMSVQRSQGNRCGSVDIFTSQGITISHIIGPAVPSSSSVADPNAPDHCVMSSIHQDSTFAIYFTIDDVIISNWVYFQFIVKYINEKNEK